MITQLRRILWVTSTTAVFLINPNQLPAQIPSQWQTLSHVRSGKSHVVPSFWANQPHLDAKKTIKILDINGPGVVTMIHASALGTGMGKGFDSDSAQSVIVRVFYDGESSPSIEMPYMDFFADIQCRSSYFNTIYFSKVKESHNFRLAMPFRKHITIEVENPSDRDLVGYVDVQWEAVTDIPDDCGYLRADYRCGNINANKPMVLFELNHPAKIVAHWMQYESAKSEKGEIICEGNQELYLDGDEQPTLNYLGTEDVYGYSWGYKGVHSDNYAAIIKRDDLKPHGSRIAILRCRDKDAISFEKSCRWVLTYLTDPWTLNKLGDSPIPYRHCVYYYSFERDR